jgi:hypothetical protein
MSQELIAHITTAFANVVFPGDHDLTSSTYGDEPEALKRAFWGKTDWRKLDSAFLDSAPDGWGTALSFFSDRAFMFYLPAYLIADLKNELASVSPEFHLTSVLLSKDAQTKVAECWGGGTIAQYALRRFDQFDGAQARAIVAYLRWKLAFFRADFHYEYAEIVQVLEGYWLARTHV